MGTLVTEIVARTFLLPTAVNFSLDAIGRLPLSGGTVTVWLKVPDPQANVSDTPFSAVVPVSVQSDASTTVALTVIDPPREPMISGLALNPEIIGDGGLVAAPADADPGTPSVAITRIDTIPL